MIMIYVIHISYISHIRYKSHISYIICISFIVLKLVIASTKRVYSKRNFGVGKMPW